MVEYLATALSITGAILLAIGLPILVPLSLLVQIAGGLLWCVYAHTTDQMPLLTVNIAFIIVEIVGLINWS